jgi:hypothetical protein
MKKHAFARVTDAHDRAMRSLSPSAGYLYRHLLRSAPAGVEVEVFLESVAEELGYSLRQMRRAIAELFSCGLVEPVRQYTKKIFKVVAYHADRIFGAGQDCQDSDRNVQSATGLSQKQPSNPHDAVCITESIREQQTGCVPQGFSELKPDEQDTTDPDPVTSDRRPDAGLLAECREAIGGGAISPDFAAEIAQHDRSRIRAAIAALNEAKPHNPIGFLRRAIAAGWRPRQTTAPVGFQRWFDEKRSQGLVIASQAIDGVVHVLWNDDRGWQPWS